MLEILQDKNAPYLITAYGVFLGGIAFYLISLVLRRRGLDQDEATLAQIEAEAVPAQETGAAAPDVRVTP